MEQLALDLGLEPARAPSLPLDERTRAALVTLMAAAIVAVHRTHPQEEHDDLSTGAVES